MWSGALSWWGLTLWYFLFRTPDLTDLHFCPSHKKTNSAFGILRMFCRFGRDVSRTPELGISPRDPNGFNTLMSACGNPAATPEMPAGLCRDGTIGVCHRRRPKSFVLVLIFWLLFEMAVWLRLLTSDFATGLAHMRGGTALHNFGSSERMAACENPSMTYDVLTSLCRDGTTIDITKNPRD